MPPLGIVAGVLLVAFVPGFLLVRAAFPRGVPTGDRPGSEASLTLLLSVVLSLAVATLAGLVLGFLPADGRGAFQGRVTGAPYLEATLLGTSLVLFSVAFARGAFPRLAALAGWTPAWGRRDPHAPPTRRSTLDELVALRREETALALRILALRVRSLLPQPRSARRDRRRRLDRLREERADLRDRADAVEDELARASREGWA